MRKYFKKPISTRERRRRKWVKFNYMEKAFTCSKKYKNNKENILIWGKTGIGKSYITEIIKNNNK